MNVFNWRVLRRYAKKHSLRFGASIKGGNKPREEPHYVFKKMAPGEISYLIFIASAICIGLRLRRQFGY